MTQRLGVAHASGRGSVDGHFYRSRGNAVGDGLQSGSTQSNRRRNIEFRRNDLGSGRYSPQPAVRSAIPDAPAGVGDPHQREVGEALIVVSVISALRHSVELSALDDVVDAAVSER